MCSVGDDFVKEFNVGSREAMDKKATSKATDHSSYVLVNLITLLLLAAQSRKNIWKIPKCFFNH